ncbi:MAG: hypothetical protein IT464_10275 [Planctomycetes bacterium]|nr:hypothetical protein [Planctomycetota bacterium]
MNMLAQETSSAFAGLGFLVFWLVLAAVFGWWGKGKAEDHGAPGWLGFTVVFAISVTLSMLAGLLAVYALVPLVSELWAQSRRLRDRPLHTRASNGPPPMPPSPELQAPAPDGTIGCPGCGARVRTDRRSCMSCGTMLR